MKIRNLLKRLNLIASTLVLRHLIAVGALMSVVPAWAEDPVEMPVRLAAGRVNIRTSDGDWRCTVDRAATLVAVGRHSDGERVKVRINARGCPQEGYIYSNFIRPTYGAGHEEVITSVEPDELALRGKPSPHGDYLCGLAKGSTVKIIEDNPPGASSSSWVKVKALPAREGCPDEGFVNGSYLKMDHAYDRLPVASESVARRERQGNTEADFCQTGTCDRERVANAENIEAIGRVVNGAPPRQPPKGSFWDGLREMVRNPRKKPSQLKVSRGLVQIPLEGRGNVGPCGSHHYSPDKPVGVDAYANPLTACVFSSVLQDWKKNNCPNRSGCTLSWGDISHKTKPRFNTHQTHTDGQCIDIRPMRKGGFADAGLNYGGSVCTKRRGRKCVKWKTSLNPAYDQATTKQLVQKLKAAGGTNIYFNDTSTGSGPMSGHSNHVHVCFKDNAKTRSTCDGFVPDLNVCPELQ